MSETPYITDVYAGAAQWDQSSFHRFQASRDPEQVAADDIQLKKMFSEIASPTFKEAYKWAQENGVKFFIDHTVVQAGGYYTMGTGVVGIAARYANRPAMAGPILTHEIRHAWQDKQGFIPTVARNFAEYFMKISLMEADAMAFERVARTEELMLGSEYENEGIKLPPLSAKPDRLMQGFDTWARSRGELYGETAARYFGSRMEIDGITPRNFFMSYQPFKYGGCPRLKGIDVADIDKAIEAGASFDGTENYLDNKKMRDYLERTLLKPSLAQKFYAANANRLPPLVKEVNKRFRSFQSSNRKYYGYERYL